MAELIWDIFKNTDSPLPTLHKNWGISPHKFLWILAFFTFLLHFYTVSQKRIPPNHQRHISPVYCTHLTLGNFKILKIMNLASNCRCPLWFPLLCQPEGQHPLTVQRTANFKLLANQWAEPQATDAMTSRLPRSESKCVQCRCFQCGPVPLHSDIKGTEVPPADILIPLERQLIALQLCCWEFLYNETFQQTFRPLLLKLSKRRQI